MEKDSKDLLAEVADYYSGKLMEYGATPCGVDWNGEDSQILRFAQLSKIIQHVEGFSINDVGCGYGALLDYLQLNYHDFYYIGCDVCSDMIDAAISRHSQNKGAKFIVAGAPSEEADYGIASGIFNVRQGRSETEWYQYIESILELINSTSRHGFAFNCLTSYSDLDKKKNYLYYADPCIVFDLCKTRFSPHVSLLHDYGLYEFTILVRKKL